MDSFKFAPPKRSFILQIRRIFRVVGSFFRFVVMKSQFVRVYSKIRVPFFSGFFPKLKSIFTFPLIWANKVFQFHLFKFAGAKSKIPRGNFIPESFTYLCDSER